MPNKPHTSALTTPRSQRVIWKAVLRLLLVVREGLAERAREFLDKPRTFECTPTTIRLIFSAADLFGAFMMLETAIFTTWNWLDLCSAKGQDSQDKPEERKVAPLPNVRQEAFAQAVAAGKSASAAYAAAYGRSADTTSRVNGKRLLTNANVRARIGQIRDEASGSAHPTLQKIFKTLEEAALEDISSGSLRSACKKAEQYSKMALRLSRLTH
ncbi:hypothetical protein [Methylocystis sp.]|uniref:hypothetical protein n=1 Tax=Methylocystis sp. TaxID=1911079 RepID=UPI0025F57E11|nr:hypothetical protein [Methylocystis sp.]